MKPGQILTAVFLSSVPQVLKSCTEFIEKHGVVDGIYRLSGIASNIQKLRYETQAAYLLQCLSVCNVYPELSVHAPSIETSFIIGGAHKSNPIVPLI